MLEARGLYPKIFGHLLVGSSSGVQRTIYQLHTLGYAEVARWTHPITIPDRQIIITPDDQGEVMSLLVKLIRPNYIG